MKSMLKRAFQYSHLGVVMLVIMFGGWSLGGWVDRSYNLGGLGEILGFFAGFIAGMTYVVLEGYKLTREINDELDSKHDESL